MRQTPSRPLVTGMLTGLPFLLVIGPFGLLFGVVATEAGLPLAQVMAFSVLVIAGASQFTAVQLLSENAPALVVLASALAVNLRMAMYSASLAPHLGKAPLWKRALVAYLMVDQTYALASQNYETNPARPVADKVWYYFGLATPLVPFWYLCTWAGAVLGTAIPPQFALDFAIPITFLALVAPALRSAAHIAAAATGVVLAACLQALPYNLWLMVAGIGAMVVGAEVERRLTRARAQKADQA